MAGLLSSNISVQSLSRAYTSSSSSYDKTTCCICHRKSYPLLNDVRAPIFPFFSLVDCRHYVCQPCALVNCDNAGRHIMCPVCCSLSRLAQTGKKRMNVPPGAEDGMPRVAIDDGVSSVGSFATTRMSGRSNMTRSALAGSEGSRRKRRAASVTFAPDAGTVGSMHNSDPEKGKPASALVQRPTSSDEEKGGTSPLTREALQMIPDAPPKFPGLPGVSGLGNAQNAKRTKPDASAQDGQTVGLYSLSVPKKPSQKTQRAHSEPLRPTERQLLDAPQIPLSRPPPLRIHTVEEDEAKQKKAGKADDAEADRDRAPSVTVSTSGDDSMHAPFRGLHALREIVAAEIEENLKSCFALEEDERRVLRDAEAHQRRSIESQASSEHSVLLGKRLQRSLLEVEFSTPPPAHSSFVAVSAESAVAPSDAQILALSETVEDQVSATSEDDTATSHHHQLHQQKPQREPSSMIAEKREAKKRELHKLKRTPGASKQAIQALQEEAGKLLNAELESLSAERMQYSATLAARTSKTTAKPSKPDPVLTKMNAHLLDLRAEAMRRTKDDIKRIKKDQQEPTDNAKRIRALYDELTALRANQVGQMREELQGLRDDDLVANREAMKALEEKLSALRDDTAKYIKEEMELLTRLAHVPTSLATDSFDPQEVESSVKILEDRLGDVRAERRNAKYIEKLEDNLRNTYKKPKTRETEKVAEIIKSQLSDLYSGVSEAPNARSSSVRSAADRSSGVFSETDMPDATTLHAGDSHRNEEDVADPDQLDTDAAVPDSEAPQLIGQELPEVVVKDDVHKDVPEALEEPRGEADDLKDEGQDSLTEQPADVLETQPIDSGEQINEVPEIEEHAQPSDEAHPEPATDLVGKEHKGDDDANAPAPSSELQEARGDGETEPKMHESEEPNESEPQAPEIETEIEDEGEQEQVEELQPHVSLPHVEETVIDGETQLLDAPARSADISLEDAAIILADVEQAMRLADEERVAVEAALLADELALIQCRHDALFQEEIATRKLLELSEDAGYCHFIAEHQSIAGRITEMLQRRVESVAYFTAEEEELGRQEVVAREENDRVAIRQALLSEQWAIESEAQQRHLEVMRELSQRERQVAMQLLRDMTAIVGEEDGHRVQFELSEQRERSDLQRTSQKEEILLASVEAERRKRVERESRAVEQAQAYHEERILQEREEAAVRMLIEGTERSSFMSLATDMNEGTKAIHEVVVRKAAAESHRHQLEIQRYAEVQVAALINDEEVARARVERKVMERMSSLYKQLEEGTAWRMSQNTFAFQEEMRIAAWRAQWQRHCAQQHMELAQREADARIQLEQQSTTEREYLLRDSAQAMMRLRMQAETKRYADEMAEQLQQRRRELDEDRERQREGLALMDQAKQRGASSDIALDTAPSASPSPDRSASMQDTSVYAETQALAAMRAAQERERVAALLQIELSQCVRDEPVERHDVETKERMSRLAIAKTAGEEARLLEQEVAYREAENARRTSLRHRRRAIEKALVEVEGEEDEERYALESSAQRAYARLRRDHLDEVASIENEFAEQRASWEQLRRRQENQRRFHENLVLLNDNEQSARSDVEFRETKSFIDLRNLHVRGLSEKALAEALAIRTAHAEMDRANEAANRQWIESAKMITEEESNDRVHVASAEQTARAFLLIQSHESHLVAAAATAQKHAIAMAKQLEESQLAQQMDAERAGLCELELEGRRRNDTTESFIRSRLREEERADREAIELRQEAALQQFFAERTRQFALAQQRCVRDESDDRLGVEEKEQQAFGVLLRAEKQEAASIVYQAEQQSIHDMLRAYTQEKERSALKVLEQLQVREDENRQQLESDESQTRVWLRRAEMRENLAVATEEAEARVSREMASVLARSEEATKEMAERQAMLHQATTETLEEQQRLQLEEIRRLQEQQSEAHASQLQMLRDEQAAAIATAIASLRSTPVPIATPMSSPTPIPSATPMIATPSTSVTTTPRIPALATPAAEMNHSTHIITPPPADLEHASVQTPRANSPTGDKHQDAHLTPPTHITPSAHVTPHAPAAPATHLTPPAHVTPASQSPVTSPWDGVSVDEAIQRAVSETVKALHEQLQAERAVVAAELQRYPLFSRSTSDRLNASNESVDYGVSGHSVHTPRDRLQTPTISPGYTQNFVGRDPERIFTEPWNHRHRELPVRSNVLAPVVGVDETSYNMDLAADTSAASTIQSYMVHQQRSQCMFDRPVRSPSVRSATTSTGTGGMAPVGAMHTGGTPPLPIGHSTDSHMQHSTLTAPATYSNASSTLTQTSAIPAFYWCPVCTQPTLSSCITCQTPVCRMCGPLHQRSGYDDRQLTPLLNANLCCHAFKRELQQDAASSRRQPRVPPAGAVKRADSERSPPSHIESTAPRPRHSQKVYSTPHSSNAAGASPLQNLETVQEILPVVHIERERRDVVRQLMVDDESEEQPLNNSSQAAGAAALSTGLNSTEVGSIAAAAAEGADYDDDEEVLLDSEAPQPESANNTRTQKYVEIGVGTNTPIRVRPDGSSNAAGTNQQEPKTQIKKIRYDAFFVPLYTDPKLAEPRCEKPPTPINYARTDSFQPTQPSQRAASKRPKQRTEQPAAPRKTTRGNAPQVRPTSNGSAQQRARSVNRAASAGYGEQRKPWVTTTQMKLSGGQRRAVSQESRRENRNPRTYARTKSAGGQHRSSGRPDDYQRYSSQPLGEEEEMYSIPRRGGERDGIAAMNNERRFQQSHTYSHRSLDRGYDEERHDAGAQFQSDTAPMSRASQLRRAAEEAATHAVDTTALSGASGRGNTPRRTASYGPLRDTDPYGTSNAVLMDPLRYHGRQRIPPPSPTPNENRASSSRRGKGHAVHDHPSIEVDDDGMMDASFNARSSPTHDKSRRAEKMDAGMNASYQVHSNQQSRGREGRQQQQQQQHFAERTETGGGGGGGGARKISSPTLEELDERLYTLQEQRYHATEKQNVRATGEFSRGDRQYSRVHSYGEPMQERGRREPSGVPCEVRSRGAQVDVDTWPTDYEVRFGEHAHHSHPAHPTSRGRSTRGAQEEGAQHYSRKKFTRTATASSAQRDSSPPWRTDYNAASRVERPPWNFSQPRSILSEGKRVSNDDHPVARSRNLW